MENQALGRDRQFRKQEATGAKKDHTTLLDWVEGGGSRNIQQKDDQTLKRRGRKRESADEKLWGGGSVYILFSNADKTGRNSCARLRGGQGRKKL